MQFGNNYLNNGHLLPEITRINGRDSFNSVSQRSLAVSFEVPDATDQTTTMAVHSGWLQREQGDACRMAKEHQTRPRLVRLV